MYFATTPTALILRDSAVHTMIPQGEMIQLDHRLKQLLASLLPDVPSQHHDTDSPDRETGFHSSLSEGVEICATCC